MRFELPDGMDAALLKDQHITMDGLVVGTFGNAVVDGDAVTAKVVLKRGGDNVAAWRTVDNDGARGGKLHLNIDDGGAVTLDGGLVE